MMKTRLLATILLIGTAQAQVFPKSDLPGRTCQSTTTEVCAADFNFLWQRVAVQAASCPGGTSSPGAPTCSLTTRTGTVGTTVGIHGANLCPMHLVTFSGAVAVFSTVSDTQAAAVAPSNVGTVNVSVTSPYGPPANCGTFTYDTPLSPPTITSPLIASPSSINVGDSATLSWAVSGATSVSIQHGTTTDYSCATMPCATSLSVAPTTSTTYTLAATNAAGTTTATTQVTVLAAPPSFSISSVLVPGVYQEGSVPTLHGPPDTILTINGSGFTVGSTSVTIDGVACTLLSPATTTKILCKVGSHAYGATEYPITVTVGSTALAGPNFIYRNAKVYYATPNGTGNCLTPTTGCKRQTALNLMVAGDTLYLRALAAPETVYNDENFGGGGYWVGSSGGPRGTSYVATNPATTGNGPVTVAAYPPDLEAGRKVVWGTNGGFQALKLVGPTVQTLLPLDTDSSSSCYLARCSGTAVRYLVFDGIVFSGEGGSYDAITLSWGDANLAAAINTGLTPVQRAQAAVAVHHIRFMRGEIRYGADHAVHTTPGSDYVDWIDMDIHHNRSQVTNGAGGMYWSGRKGRMIGGKIRENDGNGIQIWSAYNYTSVNDNEIRGVQFYRNGYNPWSGAGSDTCYTGSGSTQASVGHCSPNLAWNAANHEAGGWPYGFPALWIAGSRNSFTDNTIYSHQRAGIEMAIGAYNTITGNYIYNHPALIGGGQQRQFGAVYLAGAVCTTGNEGCQSDPEDTAEAAYPKGNSKPTHNTITGNWFYNNVGGGTSQVYFDGAVDASNVVSPNTIGQKP